MRRQKFRAFTFSGGYFVGPRFLDAQSETAKAAKVLPTDSTCARLLDTQAETLSVYARRGELFRLSAARCPGRTFECLPAPEQTVSANRFRRAGEIFGRLQSQEETVSVDRF